MAINASDWCESFLIWWEDDDFPKPTDDKYRMKIMDGGMLLFEEQENPGAFLVAAPHAWKGIRTAFDLTKRHRRASKANKTAHDDCLAVLQAHTEM
jgi:hypothetical protein